jgi:hypothetical protein
MTKSAGVMQASALRSLCAAATEAVAAGRGGGAEQRAPWELLQARARPHTDHEKNGSSD